MTALLALKLCVTSAVASWICHRLMDYDGWGENAETLLALGLVLTAGCALVFGVWALWLL